MQRENRPLGRPKQEHQEKPTKNVILDVATQLFLNKSYQVVSMDDVAIECGVTKATVYYYYKSKAELFTDAMVQMMLRIKDRIFGILSTDKPLRDRLFEFAKAHLQATVDIDINGFMKEAKASLSEEQLLQMKHAEEKMYEILEKALISAMEKGEIPQGHPRLGAHAFVALLKVGNYRDVNQKPIFGSLDEMTEQIVDFYWNGLGN
ncbi:TetR/AcrR family transcriptional regulator [Bacillus sp. FJAT-49736]|uniref:TetR/AcrR family transcriptional regulator n=1 Tax=Bacillus sp. FJAT-49736 TaxID=2833582 RepID=UPI001BCA2FEB|nr:TetR/AcrR family transcriptional regulator [Bacillus sp. FJAT-49736]MBS4172983.1 TetR/AcrR family transcriptional regulator [Bacillus sp. FJAT-49736]